MQNEINLISARDYRPDALGRLNENRHGYYFLKRTMDITLSLLLLIALSPLMLAIAIAIYIYSPGPVFFVQERVGAKRIFSGKRAYWKPVIFKCLKFRTMKVNVDSTLHQRYIKSLIENDRKGMAEIQGQETETGKILNDPRVTRPGKILRKLSLDELPQLFNVLRGDMSLVGPRPAIEYEVEMYKPWHLRRLEALPGISGLQQVTARCITDFDEQVKLDIQYIENQNIWLDLKIALKTPLAIVSARGAY